MNSPPRGCVQPAVLQRPSGRRVAAHWALGGTAGRVGAVREGPVGSSASSSSQVGRPGRAGGLPLGSQRAVGASLAHPRHTFGRVAGEAAHGTAAPPPPPVWGEPLSCLPRTIGAEGSLADSESLRENSFMLADPWLGHRAPALGWAWVGEWSSSFGQTPPTPRALLRGAPALPVPRPSTA